MVGSFKSVRPWHITLGSWSRLHGFGSPPICLLSWTGQTQKCPFWPPTTFQSLFQGPPLETSQSSSAFETSQHYFLSLTPYCQVTTAPKFVSIIPPRWRPPPTTYPVSLHLRAYYPYLSGLYLNLDNVAVEGIGHFRKLVKKQEGTERLLKMQSQYGDCALFPGEWGRTQNAMEAAMLMDKN